MQTILATASPFVEGAICATARLTKSCVVAGAATADSRREVPSPKAMLEGNEGERNYEIVNCGGEAETTGA